MCAVCCGVICAVFRSQLDESLVFCSSPAVASALFMSDPSARLVFTDNYGSPSGGGGGGEGEDTAMLLGEADMPAYRAAQQMTPLVLLCCDLDVAATGVSAFLQDAASAKEPQTIRLPVNASARADLLRELRGSKKAVGLQLEHGMGWLYTLPPSRRQGGRASASPTSNSAEGRRAGTTGFNNAEVVSLEYICVCTDSLLEGGLKLLEQRLEVLLTPSVGGWTLEDQHEGDGDESPPSEGGLNVSSSASASAVLKRYEGKLKQQVQKYVDQVLEELTTEQADVLRGVSGQVQRKEDQLRQLKEELVQERKLQENLLRDMRVFGEQGGGSGNDGGGKAKGKTRSAKY